MARREVLRSIAGDQLKSYDYVTDKHSVGLVAPTSRSHTNALTPVRYWLCDLARF